MTLLSEKEIDRPLKTRIYRFCKLSIIKTLQKKRDIKNFFFNWSWNKENIKILLKYILIFLFIFLPLFLYLLCALEFLFYYTKAFLKSPLQAAEYVHKYHFFCRNIIAKHNPFLYLKEFLYIIIPNYEVYYYVMEALDIIRYWFIRFFCLISAVYGIYTESLIMAIIDLFKAFVRWLKKKLGQ